VVVARSIVKKVTRWFAVLVVFAALCIAYLYTEDSSRFFYARRGTYAHATLTPAGGDSLSEKSWLRIENTDGFTVECGLLTPRDTGKRYPAIILLGGKTTGKFAVNYALDVRNMIIASPDYAYEPAKQYSLMEFLRDVPALRRALLDMVPSVMMLTDYLFQRNDVDTTKLVLVGYSFGAPLVPCILAHDSRAAAAAIVYGGGELRSLIRHNVRRYEGALMSEFVGLLGGLLLRPIEPLRYVGNLPSKPLLMINGTDDEQIPRENIDLLYAYAREPKKIIWITSKHVHPRNPALTATIVATLQEEFSALGITGNEQATFIPPKR
jgi:predicted esterase